MKLLRYLIDTILFVVLWCLMFLPVMKYSIDTGGTSIAAIGGIIAIFISYALVKKINKSKLWANLFDEKEENKSFEKVDKKIYLKKDIPSKGWMRLHIIFSLILPIINLSDGSTDSVAYTISLLLFIGYWLIVGLIVWVIKGFKEE